MNGQVTVSTTRYNRGLLIAISNNRYDGDKPVLEENNAGTKTAVATFGPNGLLARTDATRTLLYTFDPMGNLSQQIVAGTGVIAATYLCNAFGNRQVTSADTPAKRYIRSIDTQLPHLPLHILESDLQKRIPLIVQRGQLLKCGEAHPARLAAFREGIDFFDGSQVVRIHPGDRSVLQMQNGMSDQSQLPEGQTSLLPRLPPDALFESLSRLDAPARNAPTPVDDIGQDDLAVQNGENEAT